ncbi:MAG: hypothetical protein EOO62_30315 [Hymenobacter sp.]|nr:MAG: hypothetical protein EOO62_30315 [Hymenobacter sp.]
MPHDSKSDMLLGSVYTLCVVVALVFALFLLAKLRYSSLKLRKPALYVVFLLLGVAFLFGEPLFHWLADLAYGVQDAPGQLNASGAAIEAAAKVGGWVPVGTATSKIILTVSFYVLSYLLPWWVQRVTHPAPTDWTKDSYTGEFTALPSIEKFQLVGRLSLNQSIRFAASMLAAALIQ